MKEREESGLSVKQSIFSPPTTQTPSREPVDFGLEVLQPGSSLTGFFMTLYSAGHGTGILHLCGAIGSLGGMHAACQTGGVGCK